MLSFWIYILKCSDGPYYVGHTDNLERRIAEHEEGVKCRYAKNRRPVKLMYSDEFKSRVEALQFERQIKGWSRNKKEALIMNDWDRIKQLSKSHNRKCRASTGSARTKVK